MIDDAVGRVIGKCELQSRGQQEVEEFDRGNDRDKRDDLDWFAIARPVLVVTAALNGVKQVFDRLNRMVLFFVHRRSLPNRNLGREFSLDHPRLMHPPLPVDDHLLCARGDLNPHTLAGTGT